jgi:hypothetical protein
MMMIQYRVSVQFASIMCNNDNRRTTESKLMKLSNRQKTPRVRKAIGKLWKSLRNKRTVVDDDDDTKNDSSSFAERLEVPDRQSAP